MTVEETRKQGPEGGDLITVGDVPYELEEGLTLAEVKAKEASGQKGWRCRRGWHSRVTIAKPATLAMIEEMSPLAMLTSSVARHYSDLSQCARCGEVGRALR